MIKGDISSTLEDYLEAIFKIESSKRVARVRDISGTLSVAKSAVTAALQALARKGLVNYEPYEPATLTPKGRAKAERIVLSHYIIEDFLLNVLALEPAKAQSVACGMEHAISDEALERFVCFLAFVRQEERVGGRWLSEFRRFVKDGAEGLSCEECAELYMRTSEEERKEETAQAGSMADLDTGNSQSALTRERRKRGSSGSHAVLP